LHIIFLSDRTTKRADQEGCDFIEGALSSRRYSTSHLTSIKLTVTGTALYTFYICRLPETTSSWWVVDAPHPLSPLHWNFPQRGKTQNRAVEKNKAKIKANALHSNEEWLSLGLSL